MYKEVVEAMVSRKSKALPKLGGAASNYDRTMLGPRTKSLFLLNFLLTSTAFRHAKCIYIACEFLTDILSVTNAYN